jgi:hypothetical protein
MINKRFIKNIKKSFVIVITILVFLLNQKSYGQDTIETDIDSFLSEKQKEFMYLLIKEDLTFYSSKKNTDSLYERVYKPDIIKTSANELFKSYHENEISADDIYRNKKVILSGIIADINRGVGEQYYIRFVLPDQFSSISAFFYTEYKEELAKLKRNQHYRVFCICDGMLMGSPTLKQCKPVNDWIEEETIKILNNSYFNLKNLTKINDIFTNEDGYLIFMFFIKIKKDTEVEKLVNLLKQGIEGNKKKQTEFLSILITEKEKNIFNKIESTNDVKSLDIFQKIKLIKQEREKILSGDSNSN